MKVKPCNIIRNYSMCLKSQYSTSTGPKHVPIIAITFNCCRRVLRWLSITPVVVSSSMSCPPYQTRYSHERYTIFALTLFLQVFLLLPHVQFSPQCRPASLQGHLLVWHVLLQLQQVLDSSSFKISHVL